jgi:hypothetical protein
MPMARLLSCLTGALCVAMASSAWAVPDWSGLWLSAKDPARPAAQLGGTRPGDLPTLTPKYQALYDKVTASFATGSLAMDKTVHCERPGMPLMMSLANGGEILMTRGRVTIISEWAGDVRRIFTDGRPHPKDLDPTFEGHSIGHWEGNDLVVDTVSISTKASLTLTGVQQSEQMHIVERFHEYAPGKLEILFHIEDPEAFTRPWDYRLTWKRNPDRLDYVHEYSCDNNRNAEEISPAK